MKKRLLFCFIAVALLIQGEAYKSKTNPGSAPKALVEISGETYFFAGTDQVTWYEAGVRCQQMNMQLVSLETEEKWNSFVEFITANPYFDAWWWTSGHRSPQQTDFTWTSTGNTFDYTHWNVREPNLGITDDACVSFLVDVGGWDDDGCTDYTFGYVCENIPA